MKLHFWTTFLFKLLAAIGNVLKVYFSLLVMPSGTVVAAERKAL